LKRLGVLGPVDLTFCGNYLPPGPPPPPHQAFPLIGQLVAHLLDRGFKITVFNLSRQISQPWMAEGPDLAVCLVPQRKSRAVYDFYRQERRVLGSWMRRSTCAFFHAHWTYEFASAAMDVNPGSLITAHDDPGTIATWSRWTRIYPHWAFRAWLGRRNLLRTHFLTTVSRSLLAAVQPWIRPWAKTFVTPNGIPDDVFRLCPHPRLPPSQGQFRITTVAEGFHGRKNGEAALRAFFQFHKKFPASCLQMVGTGYEAGGEAYRWATAQGMRAGVVFMGHQDYRRVLDFLHKETDVFLHTSKDESFCMSALEAMALGIPVVAGKESGNIPNLLDFGNAGMLVDVTCATAIAKGLETLAGDPSCYQGLSERGRRQAQNFSMRRMVDSYEEVYRAIWNGVLPGGA
jgi:glycosyltransferase involved in cell wall biosynthesis